LRQNLEPVPHPQHDPATVGELLYRLHHRRKLRNRARAQVVPKRKTARHDDGIAVFQVMRFMPEKAHRLLGHLLDGPVSVVIAVGSGENDDAKFHGKLASPEGIFSSLPRKTAKPPGSSERPGGRDNTRSGSSQVEGGAAVAFRPAPSASRHSRP